ncbi:MAG: pilus assembly protein PilP [Litorivicinus sp.]
MTVRTVMVVATLMLGGCASDAQLSDLERFVAQVKARPGGEIEPVPTFENYEPFVYQANALRSPFLAPIEVREVNRPQSNPNIKPNLDRTREYLEQFSLDALSMVGTLALRDGLNFALIADAQGQISKVTIGNYIGENYGRITAVSEGRIELTEIVPDGGEGWLERPRTLALKDPTQ